MKTKSWKWKWKLNPGLGDKKQIALILQLPRPTEGLCIRYCCNGTFYKPDALRDVQHSVWKHWQQLRVHMSCRKQPNLNHGIERGAKLSLELLFNLHHVHLTTTDDHSHQSAIGCTRTLSTAHPLNMRRMENTRDTTYNYVSHQHTLLQYTLSYYHNHTAFFWIQWMAHDQHFMLFKNIVTYVLM